MSNQLTTLLANHCFSIYEEEVTATETTLKCRLVPLTEADVSMTLAETYALKFIREALQMESSEWRLDASRPWVLKDNKLVYTWRFILKGNIDAAYNALLKIDKAPTQANTFVPVRKSVSARGTVTVRR